MQVIFEQALSDEGLVELITPERLELELADPQRPILLAVSDNGPQMTSDATRAFMAAMAVAQRHGRPHTPTDQAWIETLFGHVKGEWPHLERITDPRCSSSSSSSSASELNTTRCVCMPASVTSRPGTSTPVEETRSARPDDEASSGRASSGSPIIVVLPNTPRRSAYDLGHFGADFRG